MTAEIIRISDRHAVRRSHATWALVWAWVPWCWVPVLVWVRL